MSPDRIRALAQAINTGKRSTDYRELGFVSRSAAISRARDHGFHFGQAVTPEMLDRALTPKPEPIRKPPRTILMDDESPIRALAAECLTEHRILQNALPAMVERVMADGDLREAALREIVSAHCQRLLTVVQQETYQAVKRQSGGGPLGQQRKSAESLAAHAQAVASSLLDDFILPGGKKLGDATRIDLQRALSIYQIQVTDARSKAGFVRLVMQCVTGTATVRECVKPERAAELRELAQREAAEVEA